MESWKLFGTVFATVFLAEIGDKTQLATFLFASDRQAALWIVFAAASAALVASTVIAVLAGTALSRVVDPKTLQILAGVGFIAVGVWTLIDAFRTS